MSLLATYGIQHSPNLGRMALEVWGSFWSKLGAKSRRSRETPNEEERGGSVPAGGARWRQLLQAAGFFVGTKRKSAPSRPFHQKSTCLTELTFGRDVVLRILSTEERGVRLCWAVSKPKGPKLGHVSHKRSPLIWQGGKPGGRLCWETIKPQSPKDPQFFGETKHSNIKGEIRKRDLKGPL